MFHNYPASAGSFRTVCGHLIILKCIQKHYTSWSEKFLEIKEEVYHFYLGECRQIHSECSSPVWLITQLLVSGSLGLSPTCCVTLGKSLNLSEPPFIHPRNESNNPSLRVGWRLNKLMSSGCSQWLEALRTQEVFLLCPIQLPSEPELSHGRAAEVDF